jgi:large subunit ribosomal protein L14
MIYRGTYLNISDNSGAKIVKCVGGNDRMKIGDIITVTVKKTQKGKLNSKSVQKAVVVTTTKQLKRKDGSRYSFDTNTCVCVDSKLSPLGNRVMGATTYELRMYKLMKILSLTKMCI